MINEPDLGLGIDTGGTYTDAAILNMENGTIISKAKALTTRANLSIGIKNAILGLDGSLLSRIKLLAISSTLATNSVVEGKGCRVGLILIGHEASMNIPVDELVLVSGGHTLVGERAAELDTEAIERFVLRAKDKVDGFAISSYLSVRNPEHELAAKALVQSITNAPVVCGHELSSALGFNERTITAVLNARLIPVIVELISSIKNVQDALDIHTPLMIVKGDGSLMDERVAKERPVETILSGPAASIIGAKTLTNENDAIIVDVGGTTTDIGILRDGRPRLDPEGAVLGGWRTRVRAVDAFTAGIGGDSRVVIAGGKIHPSALRVIPLCIASSSYPSLRKKLEALKDAKEGWVPSYMDIDSIPQTTEFYTFCKDISGPDVGLEQSRILELVKEEPRSIREIADLMNMHPLSLDLRRLETLGMIQRIGLTPTDALHAEGSYVEYDAEASKIGIEIQAKNMEISADQFIRDIKQAVVQKIAHEVFLKLMMEEVGETHLSDVSRSLIDNMICGTGRRDYACRLELNKPIIGIGAPVSAYLPGVADIFHTRLVIPKNSEVGNAAGAISGNVMESMDVLIKPKKGLGTMENPPCTVYGLKGEKGVRDHYRGGQLC